MNLRPDQFSEMLDAYLDGRLNDDQQRSLETAAAADPALAAELSAARAAEAALKRIFEPPATAELMPRELMAPSSIPFSEALTAPVVGVPAQAPMDSAGHGGPVIGSIAPKKSPSRALTYAAAAAITLIGVGGAWFMLRDTGPAAPPVIRKEPLTPGQLYANLMKKKFKPAFVCENDAQFAKFLGDRFGSGAVLAQAPSVEVLGWDYADGMLGEATAVVMARVEEQPVVLIVDEKRFDHPLTEPGGDLHLFRGTCNGLVVYEISPFSEARLIPQVRAAEPILMQTD